MNFRFEASKATQVAAEFIQREGGSLNILKLVQLMYLLDRLSLERRGIPVVGGDYLSMKNGPVICEVLDLINGGRLEGVETDWPQYITETQPHQVALRQPADRESLADSELDMISEIYAAHGDRDQFALAEWCHRNCPEWRSGISGRREIHVEDLLAAVGKSPDRIKRVVEMEAEMRFLDEMLG